MKRNVVLYLLAAVLFAIAAVLSFINGAPFRDVLGTLGAISFLLSAIHYHRQGRGERTGRL